MFNLLRSRRGGQSLARAGTPFSVLVSSVAVKTDLGANLHHTAGPRKTRIRRGSSKRARPLPDSGRVPPRAARFICGRTGVFYGDRRRSSKAPVQSTAGGSFM